MWLKYLQKFKKDKEIYLRIKVRPSATKNILKQVLEDETLKIDIIAPPERGKANRELIKFLSEIFSVSKVKVKILSGAGDKLKLIKIIK